MPRISDQFEECVVYIYSTLGDAQNGDRSGGSGFLVSVDSTENPQYSSIYVVTNAHVIRGIDAPTIRFNRKDGAVEYITTQEDQWILHPDGDDIAAFPFNPTTIEHLSIRTLNTGLFVTPTILAKEDIGIGDDTFMIGRFFNHEGRQQNTPAIRFGNIAMMPKEKIQADSYGFPQESFLVEIRSLPGYSGSPVFIYSVSSMMDFSHRNLAHEEEALRQKERERSGLEHFAIDPGMLAHMTPKGPYLLGIDWCHLNTTERVREKNGDPILDGWKVRTNAGMAGVVPAWKIAELLDSEELIAMRKHADTEATKQKKEAGATLDMSEENHQIQK